MSADQVLIGVIGAGVAPENLIEAMVEDQLAASPGATWVISVSSLDTTPSSAEKLVACLPDGTDTEAVGSVLTRLQDAEQRKLLVFFDEDDDTIAAVKSALTLGIEVRDLCDALTRIGAIPAPEEKHMPNTTKPPTYTEKEMWALANDDLVALAESYGIDHGPMPDWETVVAAILEAQGGAPAEEEAQTEPAAPATVDGQEVEYVDDDELYTRADLEAETPEFVKNLCKVNEVVPPGKRPSIKAYIDAFLAFQDEVVNGIAGEPDDEEAVEAPEPEAPVAAAPAPADDTLSEMVRSLHQSLTEQAEVISTGLAAADVVQVQILTAIDFVLERLGRIEEIMQALVELKAPAAPVAERPVKGDKPVTRRIARP